LEPRALRELIGASRVPAASSKSWPGRSKPITGVGMIFREIAEACHPTSFPAASSNSCRPATDGCIRSNTSMGTRRNTVEESAHGPTAFGVLGGRGDGLIPLVAVGDDLRHCGWRTAAISALAACRMARPGEAGVNGLDRQRAHKASSSSHRPFTAWWVSAKLRLYDNRSARLRRN